MKKLFKIFIGLIVVLVLVFGFYLYKLHTIAVEGNSIFEKRCLNVNPHLISYKNSFLQFADSFKNPDKHTKEDVLASYNNYISELRNYVKAENIWLDTQKKYLNNWDYQLIEPSYIKQAGDYQWKMYEGYRDDAQYMLDIVDGKIATDKIAGNNYSEPKQRRDKYSKLYFDYFDKASKIDDWRKAFGNVPIPKGCTEQNLVIPDTSGSLNLEENPATSSPTLIPVNPGLAT